MQLGVWGDTDRPDAQGLDVVFGVFRKGKLTPRIRALVQRPHDFFRPDSILDKKVKWKSVLFEKHLECVKDDIETLTEYCRFFLMSVDDGKKVNGTEALQGARDAIAAKRLVTKRYEASAEAERILGWKLADALRTSPSTVISVY